jgi:uncharacterized protein with PIN domain
MDWNKLKEERCPMCSDFLKHRVANRKTKIRARHYSDIKDDMYFCFKCDFQISQHKLLKIIKQEGIKPKTFTTGLLQF